MTLYEGARQLPLRHISIRVPWSDNGWTGKVCNKPSENASCLILRRIRESRQDDLEDSIAGESWEDMDEARTGKRDKFQGVNFKESTAISLNFLI